MNNWAQTNLKQKYVNETSKILNNTFYLTINKILRTTGLKLHSDVKNKIAFVCLKFFFIIS